MLKLGVWRKESKLNEIPIGRKGIGTKWVFKKKKNGVYRARLVAKGYDQIAGIDFQYNYAPVIHDVTMRSLLLIWLFNDYHAELIDIKTAFLHGELEEEIFITIPEGYNFFCQEENMDKEDGEYLRLNKSIYGLV